MPKPDAGCESLAYPTLRDRLIRQAMMQVWQRRWNRKFSDRRYGFPPGRSAHQDLAQAQQYFAEGHCWRVDLDPEKFFDRVNHDNSWVGSRSGSRTNGF